MLRLMFVTTLLVFIAGNVQTQPLFPYKYETAALDNGLKIVLIPMKNAGLVSYYTIVRTGSRDEIEPGKTGFAHFFEHMMFRGTEKYPPEIYNEITMEMGADTNASTWDDMTMYYLHFPSRYLEKVIELQADKFMNTEYSLEAFQTEAKAILGEYNKNFANPFFQIEEKLRETAFDKSTYKHTAMGFLKDIQNMPNQYDYSRQFFERFYRPENCIVLVTGSFEPEETLNWMKKYYAEWKRGSYQTVNFTEPEQKQEKRAHVNYPGNTLPFLAISYKAPQFDPMSRDFAAVSLLSQLAFSETSNLYQKLVLDEQKADILVPEMDPHRDPYLFSVYVRLKKTEDLPDVEKAITGTLESYKKAPPDAKRLADLKSNIKYSFLMGLDTSRNVSRRLAIYLAIAREIQVIEQTFQTFDSITPEDIQKAAVKYVSNDKRTVVSLTGAK